MKKILTILAVVVFILVLFIFGFYIYLRFFWTLVDEETYKKTTYEYLSKVYYGNTEKLRCVETLDSLPSKDIKIQFNKKQLFSAESISINDQLVVFPSENKFSYYDSLMQIKKPLSDYSSVEKLLADNNYNFETYRCLSKIVKDVDPLEVARNYDGKVEFTVKGTFGDSVGVMYVFTQAERDKVELINSTGHSFYVKVRPIRNGWYYFTAK